MADDKCCCGGTSIVLACSGGSNVGQITNEAAKELDRAGTARFFCAAGVGGHISGMVASVKGADRVLVLDGCPVGCVKAIVDEENLEGYEYVVVTELGVEKNHDFSISRECIERVVRECTEKLRNEQ